MAYPSGTPFPGVRYEIVVQGSLGRTLASWLDSLDVDSSEPGRTLLSGWFADQTALHSVLGQLADMGYQLCSVRRLGDAR